MRRKKPKVKKLIRNLNIDERKRIELLYSYGDTLTEIGRQMRRDKAYLEKEIIRGWTGNLMEDGQLEYSAQLADRRKGIKYEKT